MVSDYVYQRSSDSSAELKVISSNRIGPIENSSIFQLQNPKTAQCDMKRLFILESSQRPEDCKTPFHPECLVNWIELSLHPDPVDICPNCRGSFTRFGLALSLEEFHLICCDKIEKICRDAVFLQSLVTLMVCIPKG